MERPPNGDRKNTSRSNDDAQDAAPRRRRRRGLLNLGIPFVQVDDFLNQAEDAVAVGYRVLEQTVKEIQDGYERAKKFNEQQRNWKGEGPPPPVPWTEIVDSIQNFQNIALDAMKDGAEIFSDTARSSTKALRTTAKTFEQSRDDAAAKPLLAGPVFESPIHVKVRAGQKAEPVERKIRHRGLTRLRIHAVLDPPPEQLVSPAERQKKELNKTKLAKLAVEFVGFAPLSEKDDEFSVLTVRVGHVPRETPPGEYEGLIKARNFALLIAKLRVTVESGGTTERTSPQPAGPLSEPPRTARRRTTPQSQKTAPARSRR